MQNNTLSAAVETLRKDRLQEEKTREKLVGIRQRLMRKIRSGKARVNAEEKHNAASRDLQIIGEIKKSVDALKQNIAKNK